MKPHRCTRFKKTGSLQVCAINLSITRNGKRNEQSMSRDTVQLKCVRCGHTLWVNRGSVEDNGKYLALKPGVDLGER